MKISIYLFVLFFFQLFIFQSNIFAQDYAGNRIIVSFNNDKSIENIQDIKDAETLAFLFSELNLHKIKALDNTHNKSQLLNNRPLLFVFNEDINIKETIHILKNTNLFLYAEPDYIGTGAGKMGEDFETIPSDTYFSSRQWGLKNEGTFTLSPSTVDADVDMELAWDITTGNSALTIAVLDSGARMQHPEFSGRLWTNATEAINGTDTDTNGYIDDIDGWDFANNDNNPTDDHGHGTNVAGIIVANGNNNLGYAGVNWNSKLMPLKILDNNNSGFYSWWIAAIYYAVDNGADIINMSVGGSGFSSAMEVAVNYAYANNVAVVVSIMNFNNAVPYYPAAYTNTFAIGSTDANDERTEPFFWSATSGSNYGAHIDVIAPGNFIYGLSYNSNTNYGSYWGGTSQAAPLVTGICSLMLSINPTLTVDEIRTILKDTAEDQVGDSQDTVGWDQYYGSGRVNAFNALNTTLSITENITTQIKLYPNPVKDYLNISSNNLLFNKYVLYNVLGQKVISGEVLNNRIDLSSIKSGVYFIKMNTEVGDAITQKIVKK